MKVAIGTALFFLLAGSTMCAQEQEKERPTQQGEKKQEPAAKEHPVTHEQQKAQPQEQQKAQEQHRQAQQHQAQEQQKDQAKQAEKDKSGAEKQQQQAAKRQQQQQQQVARQEQHPNGQQAQRDGGIRNARRIDEQEFHRRFGREHEFRVSRSEDRRFNYGGHYWVYNDPWPSSWAYSDQVYVDEIDGEYYLVDPVHPDARLLVVIGD